MSDSDIRDFLSDVVGDVNILVVSFRLNIHAKDGVSLEVYKWAEVLAECGARIFYYSGETVVPEFAIEGRTFPLAHFLDKGIAAQREKLFHTGSVDWEDFRQVVEVEKLIQADLGSYIVEKKIEFVIAENILAYPGNIALSLAVVNCCNDLGVKVLAHSHDYWFERRRFKKTVKGPFASLLNNIIRNTQFLVTAVINENQKTILTVGTPISEDEGRKKVTPPDIDPDLLFPANDVIVVPNLMNFASVLPDWKSHDSLISTKLRSAYDIPPSSEVLLALFPVRPVPRKELHLAIDVLKTLIRDGGMSIWGLVTHPAGDEGLAYWEDVLRYAEESGVKLLAKKDLDDEKLQASSGGAGPVSFSLDDCYRACDFVVYTSSVEGWGNALIEAVYNHKPVIVNPYPVYQTDIRPRGLKCVELKTTVALRNEMEILVLDMNPEDLVREVRDMLDRVDDVVSHNFEVGSRFFSYSSLRRSLVKLFLKLNRKEKSFSSTEPELAMSRSSWSLSQSHDHMVDLFEDPEEPRLDEIDSDSPFVFYYAMSKSPREWHSVGDVVAMCPEFPPSRIENDLSVLTLLGHVETRQVDGPVLLHKPRPLSQISNSDDDRLPKLEVESRPEDILLQECRAKSAIQKRLTRVVVEQAVIMKQLAGDTIDWASTTIAMKAFLVRVLARSLRKKPRSLSAADFRTCVPELGDRSLGGLLVWFKRRTRILSDDRAVRNLRRYLFHQRMDSTHAQSIYNRETADSSSDSPGSPRSQDSE